MESAQLPAHLLGRRLQACLYCSFIAPKPVSLSQPEGPLEVSQSFWLTSKVALRPPLSCFIELLVGKDAWFLVS